MTEPYVTLAEKKGCRLICEAFYHGTEVASDRVDAETYGAFNRAVREAVKRINADKAKYLHYFIDYHAKKDAEIARAQAAGPARQPHRGVRSGADPARRDAAHLRLAEELGHAGADRDAAGAGQSAGPAAGAHGRGGVGAICRFPDLASCGRPRSGDSDLCRTTESGLTHFARMPRNDELLVLAVRRGRSGNRPAPMTGTATAAPRSA